MAISVLDLFHSELSKDGWWVGPETFMNLYDVACESHFVEVIHTWGNETIEKQTLFVKSCFSFFPYSNKSEFPAGHDPAW